MPLFIRFAILVRPLVRWLVSVTSLISRLFDPFRRRILDPMNRRIAIRGGERMAQRLSILIGETATLIERQHRCPWSTFVQISGLVLELTWDRGELFVRVAREWGSEDAAPRFGQAMAFSSLEEAGRFLAANLPGIRQRI